MGNFNINIQGIGPHHNANSEFDANRMAAKFVKELKNAGHEVQVASFTYGSLEPLLPRKVEES